MAENQDKESKTEQPTEKRREDALERGNTPVSREIANLGFLLVVLSAGSWIAVGMSSDFAVSLSAFIERPSEFRLETSADAVVLLRALIVEIVPLLAPLFFGLMLAGVGSHIIQTPFRISWQRLAPKASHLSPSQGWKRITGARGLLELAKGMVKLIGLGCVGAWFVLTPHSVLLSSVDVAGQDLPQFLASAILTILLVVVAAMTVISLIDTLLSRLLWERGLRMTRKEVQDESKQAEGDPVVNARRRAVARSRIKRIVMKDVPKATLVIANPTHFAVALRYRRTEGGAPKVVAKGQDLIALNIRRIAEAHGIPVVEDRALARSLYKAVEVNQTIAPEFYAGIANIILVLRNAGNRHVISALEG